MCQDHWTQLWMATSNLLQEKYENEIIIASTQSQEAHQELQNVHNRNRNLGSRIDDMKREIELMQAQLTKTNSEKAELLTNMSSVLAENIRLTQEISKRLDKK
jgi:DNA-binding transcriptional regulator GbsR (MarR family)